MATTTLTMVVQNFQNAHADKTAFPEFGIPDLESTDNSCSSEDEDSVQREKYSTKEDQDVAVFMAIAERLPIKSLLHLLQGHVRSQNADVWHYDTIRMLRDATAKEEHDGAPAPQLPPLKLKKVFRFAEIRGGEIRKRVHEIESLKDVKELWWSDEEGMEMRMQAIETVKHFRKHRKTYIQAVEAVASGTDPLEVEAGVRQLSKDSFARGLEAHICSFLSRARSETVQAVLEEQKECRMCGDSYELTAESLRGQSLAYSQTSRTFAAKMGQADQIEALKAAMSTWQAEV
jgi:hypothetical protein